MKVVLGLHALNHEIRLRAAIQALLAMASNNFVQALGGPVTNNLPRKGCADEEGEQQLWKQKLLVSSDVIRRDCGIDHE
jgi:hypothetical protein